MKFGGGIVGNSAFLRDYKQIPNFKLGIIEYKNITVGDSPQMLKGRLQLFQESFTLI